MATRRKRASRWLNQAEAARLLGVSTRQVQRYGEQGLPVYGPPRRPLYRRADLETWGAAWRWLVDEMGIRPTFLSLEQARAELAERDRYLASE